MTRYAKLRRTKPRLKSVVRSAELQRVLEFEDAARLPEPSRGELEVLPESYRANRVTAPATLSGAPRERAKTNSKSSGKRAALL
jgi:hypothetical protein